MMNSPDAIIRLEEDEIDNMREMFFSINPSLLAVTIVASLLHLLFEFLAFKSDISHWSEIDRTRLEGISRSSTVMNAIVSVFTFVYMLDKRQETSILIVGSAFVSSLGNAIRCSDKLNLQVVADHSLLRFHF